MGVFGRKSVIGPVAARQKSNRVFPKSVFAVSLSFLICSGVPGYCAGDFDSASSGAKEPLQGEVEENGVAPSRTGPVAPKEPLPEPVFKKLSPEKGSGEDDSLKGKADKAQLKGHEEDEGSQDDLQPMTGTSSPDGGYLKGSAQKEGETLTGEDPDSQDQELQVEWDRWRNRLLRAVLAGAMENLNNPDAADFRWDPVRQRVMAQFPLGTIAWFACDITNDRRIKTLKLVKSSGYPNYDRAVLDAVRSLEGTSILKFPSRSRRTHVSQAGGVRTSDSYQPQYFKFGDVEHVRVPGN